MSIIIGSIYPLYSVCNCAVSDDDMPIMMSLKSLSPRGLRKVVHCVPIEILTLVNVFGTC